MKQVLDGEQLAQMIIHASASLNLQKQKINDLNVFPVPDGDTGTNMGLTISTAAAELTGKPFGSVGEVAAMTANAMLRGARGNSGVILSLLFRGFAKAVKDLEHIDGVQFSEAMKAGVTAAYKAVMKPAEGTILTVSRLASDRAEKAAFEQPSIEHILEESILEAESALAATTEQNPVLKKAGVVDAGGMGYTIILKGMLASLRGEPVPESVDVPTKEMPLSAFHHFATEDITFGYCTEFICSRDQQKDPEELREFLDGLGDSIVMIEDDDLIKVHVHTDHPGKVLEQALTYGQLLTVKVENMREQHTEILEAEQGSHHNHEEAMHKIESVKPEKTYGFVAVCAGSGFSALFEELGADGIINGGQTMNPATEDILREIYKTPAEIVYVLPNNKNIIMAAEQCVPLVKDKKVIVLPSKTVPQGISAMLQMNYDAGEAENTAAMKEAMGKVTTMEITLAARDSIFDGTPIQSGDYLLLMDGQLFGTGKDLDGLLERMAGEIAKKEVEFLNIYYGEGQGEEDADKVSSLLEEAVPDAEFTVLYGGQPVYPYLISAE